LEAPKLYRTLGLEEGASLEEIKRAYRYLAKQYHPDITKDPSTGEIFDRVVAAYKRLTVIERKRRVVNSPVRESRPQQQNPAREVDIHGLGKLVSEGFTPEMRSFAVRRLGYARRRSAYAYIRKGFYDGSEQVVCAAVEATGRLQIVQSAGELASLFSRGSRRVKHEVLNTVERVGCRSEFDHILAMGCESSDRGIRRKAEELSAQCERRTG
jgi:curved DNA-binding protein CbpA